MIVFLFGFLLLALALALAYHYSTRKYLNPYKLTFIFAKVLVSLLYLLNSLFNMSIMDGLFIVQNGFPVVI